ncbi:molybdopterin-dependent oxidoreductase [Rhodobacterales bacterium]|nr:molybdopterin-dependent oxidoreductase [Rhodobacterales bacterium]
MLSLIFATLLGWAAHAAADLDKPSGKIVLVVTGNINTTNNAGAAEFDMDMLEALPQVERTIETPWTSEATTFSGPRLKTILDAVGAKGSGLIVTALNDYSAELPYEDAETLETMLATRMNGDLMSVREKGPLFLIYPFDTNPELFNEKYFARSVWQIREVEVLE